MANQSLVNEDSNSTSIELSFSVPENDLYQFTPMEVSLTESLLTPGLQTSVKVHSYYHHLPVKNLDDFKGATINLKIRRPMLEQYGMNPEMEVSQVCYRISNRKLYNDNTEEFIIHACDQSLLNDAATLVSKLWRCTTPSSVVSDVLTNCVGVSPSKQDVEGSMPARDYIAENIHPFQVINQQANVALNGDSPDFIHYMTYENLGTHHFRSLKSLCNRSQTIYYAYSPIGTTSGYRDVHNALTYSFPCDFDLVSDLLNGVGVNGKDLSSVAIFNPLLKQFSLFGSTALGCGIGEGILKVALTNAQSNQNQDACPDYSRYYLQKRQARMGLLDQDKVALRMTVPWNTVLNAGKIIYFQLYNKNDPMEQNYGEGDYLIATMTHNIKYGGLATITMDCVSKTAGIGVV